MLQLARRSLGKNTKISCTIYRVHSTEYRGTQAVREEMKSHTQRESGRQLDSRTVSSGNGDVVSGREWRNMASGEVGLDAAGSASEPPPVRAPARDMLGLGTW
jgi:hypothetical protein